MEFGAMIGKLWAQHASDPEGVFKLCEEGLAQVASAADGTALAQITTHVAGEHLGRWQDGIALLTKIRDRGLAPAGSPDDDVILRNVASLALCAGDGAAASRFTKATDQVRVLSVAASALAGQKRTTEAVQRLQEALALASYGPGPDDPAARSLAITGNNLAYGLEEQPSRTAEETALMILAARTARKYWEVSGTWLEVERAEYRLAMTMIAAGDPQAALEHAKLCVDICEDNAAVPYEHFYGREALSRAHKAAGDVIFAKIVRDQAASYISRMKEEVMSECQETLARLDAHLSKT